MPEPEPQAEPWGVQLKKGFCVSGGGLLPGVLLLLLSPQQPLVPPPEPAERAPVGARERTAIARRDSVTTAPRIKATLMVRA